MSIACDGCGLTYVGGRGARGIFAQRRRLLDPTFWRMLLGIRRFQKAALRLLDDDPDSPLTYGEFLDQHSFDPHFVARTTRCRSSPACGRWATRRRSPTPRRTSSRSCGTTGSWSSATPRPGTPWSAGPASYVDAVRERLDVVRVGARVVRREPQARRPSRSTPLAADGGPGEHHGFDKVVIATHADEALRLLTDAGEEEQEVLGAFGYSTNVAWLHRDESVLPRRRSGRASWNYRLEGCDARGRPQPGLLLDEPAPGPPRVRPAGRHPQPRRRARRRSDVVATMTYLHPTYTAASVAAQKRLASLNDGPARLRRRLPRLGLPRGRLPLGRRRRRAAGSRLVTAATPAAPAFVRATVVHRRSRPFSYDFGTDHPDVAGRRRRPRRRLPALAASAGLDPRRGPLRGRRRPPAARQGPLLPRRPGAPLDRAPGAACWPTPAPWATCSTR